MTKALRADLPLQIAIANSEIAGTIGPLLSGLLATLQGYETVFIGSVVFCIIGVAIVKAYAPELRWANTKS